jgi:uncharacterized repeat protein (TIGR01451 family)
MRHIPGLLVLLIVATATLLPTASASAQGADADLSVTMAWVGNGLSRAAAGQDATYSVTVTNDGPDTAVGTTLIASGTDQFDFVSLTCSDPALCTGPGADLAPGGTVTAKLVMTVCCFPPGESRNALARADVSSETPDPNTGNNEAVVQTKIIGSHN